MDNLHTPAYQTKETVFNFRCREFRFALSQGLFSAAGIDTGTALLLRVFSRLLDTDMRAGKPLPQAILDAGSGVGVIGICVAAACAELAGTAAVAAFHVRSQDRDELARGFTAYNARQNNIPETLLSAHTEPLLAGPPESRWDLILSNIPAKAGKPVLEDFVFRSAALLNQGGRALIVVVNPLADFFRVCINGVGAPLEAEETGPGHTVFLYGPTRTGAAVGEALWKPVQTGGAFFTAYPAYLRAAGDYAMEGRTYHLETVHGAADFDSPGGETLAAVKLLARLGPRADFSGPVLIHEGGQGHFAAWLASSPEGCLGPLVLSGRNILALEASRINTLAAMKAAGLKAPAQVRVIPAVDLALDRERFREGLEGAAGYGLVAVFPETVPRTDRLGALWEGLTSLLAPSGLALAGLPSAEAERFDRKKPGGFTRLGDLRRQGFRALAYRASSAK